ncbi:MAG: T9SS type A sorting domain-containing protein [Bacteroidales bacterium]|nr:T9SS type A sorting domain-containing protein [Bacteroidales bacterium]
MKKITLIIFLCIVALAVRAQSYTFPSIVDTIGYPDSAHVMLYQPRNIRQGVEDVGQSLILGNLLQRYIINEPTELWGISGTVNNDTILQWYYHILNPPKLEYVYFFLYEEKNGVIRAVDSILIDTIYNPKHLFYYVPNNETDPNWGSWPLLEATFNKRQTYYYGMQTGLTGPDTIYIGYGGWQNPNRPIRFPADIWKAVAKYEPRIYWLRHKWNNGSFEEINTGDYSWWGGLFPRIRRLNMNQDTIQRTCPPPTNLSVLDYDGEGTVTLSWNSEAAHSQWQLHLVNVDDSTAAAMDTLCATPFIMLGGLSPQVHYRAYVRALCQEDDSLIYSFWSQGIDVNYSAGIATASENGKVYVTPNPADDRIMLSSYYGIERVGLYDMQGRLMKEYRYGKEMTDTYENMSVTMDVSQLSKGTYVAVVHTLFGITTRKVVKR